MPALYSLYKDKRLPGDFHVVGIGRTEYTDSNYRPYILEELNEFVQQEDKDETGMSEFVSHLHYVAFDPSISEGYEKLATKLKEITGENNPGNILYYLATPPSLYGVVPKFLKKHQLNGSHTRIIVEKPFGYDLKSSQELNRVYTSVFNEDQIYRIDHFLGKETAQNILAFRFANGIFEPLWNRNYIDYIEITAVENLGIEQRS